MILFFLLYYKLAFYLKNMTKENDPYNSFPQELGWKGLVPFELIKSLLGLIRRDRIREEKFNPLSPRQQNARMDPKQEL
jgi:hypothetical protein